MLDRICKLIVLFFLGVCGIVLVLIGGFGAADAISTVLLNRPISAVFELTEVGVALVIFFAQPYIVYNYEHIQVELFVIKRKSIKALRGISILILTIISYSVIAVGLYRSMEKSIRIMELSSGFFEFPIWPFKIAIFACAIATILIATCMVFNPSKRIPTSHPAEEGIV